MTTCRSRSIRASSSPACRRFCAVAPARKGRGERRQSHSRPIDPCGDLRWTPLILTGAEFDLLDRWCAIEAGSSAATASSRRCRRRWDAYDRSIDVLVSRVRQKLGDSAKRPALLRPCAVSATASLEMQVAERRSVFRKLLAVDAHEAASLVLLVDAVLPFVVIRPPADRRLPPGGAAHHDRDCGEGSRRSAAPRRRSGLDDPLRGGRRAAGDQERSFPHSKPCRKPA